MPVSVLDANFNSFQTEIMPIAQEQGIGVIGMKSLAAGHLFDDLTIGITAEEAIRYALSQPIASLHRDRQHGHPGAEPAHRPQFRADDA